jgi:hypothetical protein
MRLLLCCLAALVPGVAAAEFSGYGPLPARNFQPIQLIFLNLPVERARTLAEGEFALRLESEEINEIATDNPPTEALLDFETNRTVLGASVGAWRGLEVGLDVPFLSRYGGALDPLINGVEDFLGVKNPDRNKYPANHFSGDRVWRGNLTLFNGSKQYLELGDIWASAKYEVWHRDRWPLVSLRAAVKAPTGRASGVFGSGKWDFGLGLAAEYPFLSRLITYGNVALVYPGGPITEAQLTLNPIVTQSVALEGYIGKGVSMVFQQDLYTSPMHGTGTDVLDGDAVELALAINWAIGPWLVQFGGIDNVSQVISTADFTLLLRLVYSGRAWGSAAPVSAVLPPSAGTGAAP